LQKRQGIGLPDNRDWSESGAGEGDLLAMETETARIGEDGRSNGWPVTRELPVDLGKKSVYLLLLNKKKLGIKV